MATKVHMEALSPTMEEGQLVRWLKQEGDEIAEGDTIAEIETDKATMELVARGSGTLRSIKLKEGETAAVGAVIAIIAGEGEDAADAEDDAADDQAADGDDDADERPKKRDRAEAKQVDTAEEDADEEDADEEDADEKDADEEDADEEDADEDQDEAADAGKSREKRRPAARASSVGVPERKASSQRAASDGKSTQPSRGEGGRVKASPLARRLAAEAGLELGDVDGSGPGGRITKSDIEAALKSRPAAGAPGVRRLAQYDGPEVEDVPVSQMRKTIAKRLVQSIGPIPTYYLTIEVDMSRVTEARERLNARLEKHGIKASVNDFIIRAVAGALARHPEVNASWGENVVHRHHRVHIGVAVAIEDGLITPIIRDADRKGIAQIAQEVRELAARAREKKLKPDEYTGATFSISNLGMFGITEFTAIINPPESAILAVGAVEEKVVVEDGEAVIAPRMRVTMSCDHRVIDGATGAQFLQTLRDYLEEPMMILS